jgi:alginate O-acetyltransferase complex protein AlgI
MLFSSWQFILVFLPITFLVYFSLNQKARLPVFAKAWLVMASLFFYAYWNVYYLPLIVASMLFNFAVGRALATEPSSWRLTISRRGMLIVGISVNLALLANYKYIDFLIANFNLAFKLNHALPGVILPLAISFFTFQQIAYLVDSYRRETTEYDLLRYALFVTFFPQLIAGPIVHHREMMPQFASRWSSAIRYSNVLRGLFIFGIGLFKKVAIADTFAIWAKAGFDGGQQLDFYAAWATSLSYTFQLYFDFSGYCDMAIGAALLFNIRLPINFNSPYKALDIQDFWRRWHITLSRFLRDYLYIPLGGNRGSTGRTYLNIMATFALGGLWHGASWMFVVWGTLHGIAILALRIWRLLRRPMPTAIAWLVTFLFVNVSWVFFRAETWGDAERVLLGMTDFNSALGLPIASIPTAGLAWGGSLSDSLLQVLPNGFVPYIASYAMISIAFAIISQKNAFEIMAGELSWGKVATGAAVFSLAAYFTLVSSSSVFLYFNF